MTHLLKTDVAWSALAIIGLLYVIVTVYRISDFLSFHFWISRDPLSAYRLREEDHRSGTKGAKPYALITGGSGGIGFGFVQSLVKRGFGVILLSNDADGLTVAKQKLERDQHDVSVEVVHMNALTVTPQEMKTTLVDNLVKQKGLKITILINNVGGAPVKFPPAFRTLPEFDSSEIDNFINLNARFMAQLSSLMIPILHRGKTSSSKSRALIISMSSGARAGFPWLSLYSATKAFDAALSLSLAREFKATGVPIDCIAVAPGDVVSDANHVGYPRMSPTAEEFSKMVLDRIDSAVRHGRLVISPYWIHSLQIALIDILPERILQKVGADAIAGKMLAYAEWVQKGK